MGKSLSENWFLEGTLDFEYKKYLLLAYLQHVSREFAEVRLYPSFSELIFHYQNLHAFQERKQKLKDQFPQKLNEEAAQQLKLEYECFRSIPTRWETRIGNRVQKRNR